jgi:hypothetical protein
MLRSGSNPKRLTYPCQQAAMPLAASWLLAVAAFAGGSVFVRRFAKFSSVVIALAGALWIVGTAPEKTSAGAQSVQALPRWESPNSLSSVFVLDTIARITGSLARGDASVPDAFLPDLAMNELVEMLAAKGIFLHNTDMHPNGIVHANDVVIIKGNFQWTGRKD